MGCNRFMKAGVTGTCVIVWASTLMLSLDRFHLFLGNEVRKENASTLLFDTSRTPQTKSKTNTSTAQPWHIIQYGRGRTASTFQHEVICVSMFIKLYDKAQEMGGTWNVALDKFSCPFGEHRFREDTPLVIKTHNEAFSRNKDQNVWLFTTTKGEAKDEFQKLKQEGYSIKYVQDLKTLGRLGHLMPYEYQDILGLTDEQMKKVNEFMRYWTVLRQCCGVQMSKDWRKSLTKNQSEAYTAHHDVHSSSYPACLIYDIDQVEAHFLNTTLYKTMASFPKLRRSIRPSVGDDELDGTYCSRYNDAVTKFDLQFNQGIPKGEK